MLDFGPLTDHKCNNDMPLALSKVYMKEGSKLNMEGGIYVALIKKFKRIELSRDTVKPIRQQNTPLIMELT